MGLLIANDNLLTALGITNKEQFDLTFADFSEFETFVEKCGYEYDFDEEGNLILITPKSKEINTGIVVKKDYSKEYFTLEAIEETEFKFYNGYVVNKIYHSIDNGVTWVEDKNFTDNKVSFGVFQPGEKVLVKNVINRYTNDSGNNAHFESTGKCKIYGNIFSLIFGDDFIDKKEFTEQNVKTFNSLFYVQHNFIDATNLVLPGTILSSDHYGYMFENCYDLVYAPAKLYATTLGSFSCAGIFRYCTNLVSAPELPATTLALYCYSGMFDGCASLTTAPELPATTLASNCYSNMFKGCTNLNYIKMLATDISANNCLSNWVQGVPTTGTFVKNSAATWDVTGANGIPSGWTVETADS